RELAILNQIDGNLAKQVGNNLGLVPPADLDPLTVKFAKQNHPQYPLQPKKPEVEKSEALSMKVKEGEGTIKSRKVAFLVDDGVSKMSVDEMKTALEIEGAIAVLIASHVGKITYKEGGEEDVQHSYLTEASVCYDAF